MRVPEAAAPRAAGAAQGPGEGGGGVNPEKEDKSHESLVDRIAASMVTGGRIWATYAYELALKAKEEWKKVGAEAERRRLEEKLEEENNWRAHHGGCMAYFETADGLVTRNRI